MIGQDADYRVKLEWENLHWISSPRSVLLTHGKGGPKLSIDCREFVAVSPDQTRIPWKDKERWNWIETTAFGLQKHDVDLDAYISDYSELYLAEASQDGSYIGEILTQVKSHLKVDYSLKVSNSRLTSSESVGRACSEVLGCKSPLDGRMAARG